MRLRCGAGAAGKKLAPDRWPARRSHHLGPSRQVFNNLGSALLPGPLPAAGEPSPGRAQGGCRAQVQRLVKCISVRPAPDGCGFEPKLN